MKLALENKVVMVAGASQGLGFAIAKSFAQEGAKVSIASRDATRVRLAAESIQQETGGVVFPVTADTTRAEEITQWINSVEQKWGAIHVCITNTGGPPSMPFLETTDEGWQKALDLTLMSAVRLSRAVVPVMQKQQWGRIIHMCSYSVKNPIPNLVFSNAIRSAVVALSKTEADELGQFGILVNAVLPGWASTERTEEILRASAKRQAVSIEEVYSMTEKNIPIKRIGKPEEIAEPVVFLASERASFITGTTLVIDGGETRFPF